MPLTPEGIKQNKLIVNQAELQVLVATLRSLECEACGQPKDAYSIFCQDCWKFVALPLQDAIRGTRPYTPEMVELYHTALMGLRALEESEG